MEIFAEDNGSVLGINLTFNEMINRYKSYIYIFLFTSYALQRV